MIRSTLLLCAIILTVACFACAPLPPPPPPSPPPPGQPVVCKAVANIGMLPASFDPTNSNSTPPSTGPATSFQADIQAAYNAAPLFQNQLCGLDGIFVTAGPQSWGFRNRTDGKRYIAISTTLWSGNPPTAITLDQYENRVFGPPLSWTPQIDSSSPPTYLPATPNDLTVLAALAHEFGHVLWADILISPQSTPPQSSRFCSAILSEA
jgi:hypothetical protein